MASEEQEKTFAYTLNKKPDVYFLTSRVSVLRTLPVIFLWLELRKLVLYNLLFKLHMWQTSDQRVWKFCILVVFEIMSYWWFGTTLKFELNGLNTEISEHECWTSLYDCFTNCRGCSQYLEVPNASGLSEYLRFWSWLAITTLGRDRTLNRFDLVLCDQAFLFVYYFKGGIVFKLEHTDVPFTYRFWRKFDVY